MIEWEKTIQDLKLFWQYPACTEKQFFLQQAKKNNDRYIGFPWATIIDKRVNLNSVAAIIKPLLDNKGGYFTCCQHISFRKLKELFEYLNITTVYTPHKCIGEDTMGSITLLPCPLFAVNFEDPARNSKFVNLGHDDLLQVDRKYLYSFMGAYQPADYLTDIRERIYSMDQEKDVFIQNTGGWHFNQVVYSHLQNYNNDLNEDASHRARTEKYNDILLSSKFSLCPSGSGPNSIRFWESLAVGAIPILLSDSLELPKNELWDSAIIRVNESDLLDVRNILAGINNEDEISRRKKCLNLYQFYKDNYHNDNK
ncbi:MAG: hypothetical protein CME70_01480 [Halobacteriovorax sp.]|nr:hypothetical protein [Halobacteriovorax sp.]|tara:strand:- start:2778 stop:3710 length:933 start_codon:yes stop_codon:yes gene_type:complete